MAESDDIPPLMMNQTDYAEHRGVSKQAIGKLVANDRITLDDRGMIDVVATDLLLGETRERVTEPRGGDGDGASAQLTRAKAAGAVYDARLAQLKYEREIGKVVEAARVADAAAMCGELVVRAVRGLSSRVDGFLANAKDAQSMRAFCKSVEREVLSQISDAFAKMAAEATQKETGGEPVADQARAEGPSLFDRAE